MCKSGWVAGMVRVARGMALGVLVWLGPGEVLAVPSADGLYATFTVKRGNTAVGEFSCRLDYQLAPKTVANFVGLATGSRGWMDFQKGGVSHRPFYNGITFHRVVAGFVIQAGSPNGQGTDGPGYTFKDEFHASLRHSKAGILSMANSGLNSNGSQFFITLAATSHLDDVHSVFGEVVENLSVMQSVQQGDVIESVTITRNGTAAQAFDVNAQALPTVTDGVPTLVRNGTSFQLNYTQADDAEYFVRHAAGLTGWQAISGKEFYIDPPAQVGRDVTSLTTGQPAKFFTVTKVQYADALHTPATVTGKRITMVDPSYDPDITFSWDFSEVSSGTYTTSIATGFTFSMSNYTWIQEAYRSRFLGSISGLFFPGNIPVTQANFQLVFTSRTTGSCKGTLSSDFGHTFNVNGTFVVTDL